MNIDRRFLRDRGNEIFNGCELLVKGALETEGGVHLLTGYPGSPVAAFFDVLADLAPLLREKGIAAQMANNEALSVAAVNGSQMAPLRAMAVLKSVGGHVASDGLALGNLAGAHPKGGAVIVFGDDPWSESTQVPADSRFLCKHLRMPVLEPATPQAVKDFVDLGFRLSRASGLYAGFILTTTLADGGGTVSCRPNRYPLTSARHPIELHTYTLNTEETVLLPPRTGRKEEQLHLRYQKLIAEARHLDVNRLEYEKKNPGFGIVTTGVAQQYVTQALIDLGIEGGIPILKLAISYPLDEELIASFADRLEHLLVIEERRGFLEEQISEFLARRRQHEAARTPNVWGKTFPGPISGIPAVRGLNASIVADRLVRLLRQLNSALADRASGPIALTSKVIEETASVDVQIPARLPTFCPGCPHRDSSSVLLDIKRQLADDAYMRNRHRRGPVDLVCHGDTGCYTMLMFEPNSALMHNYSGMGLGGGTGAGIDPFITNKQIVFMGDSTFFHSGLTAISNSIKNGQDITYIILDNGTTAMTGHQPTPGVDVDLLGRPTFAQDIEQIVLAMTGRGRCTVVRTDPADRDNYKRILEETILGDGVKVIVADKECGITYNRRKMAAERAEEKHRGFVRKKTYMNITPEVCELCLECARSTGCPGLNIEETDYGPKMATDLSWCVNDGSCARLRACPAFEELTVIRKRPPRPRGREIKLEDLPEPTIRFDGPVWRAWLAGVGGMGIGTATGILVRAGHRQGYRVLFADKKGLAIRNGGVYSQVIFARNDAPIAQTIPYGQADLLVGLDILEALRAIDPSLPFRVASRDRTAAVVNTDKAPTVLTLIGQGDFDVDSLEQTLRGATHREKFFAHRISTLCERLFGTKLYANITMLGTAYQLGLIPVSLEAMKQGIRGTIRADFKKNMRAFNLGRKLVTNPELFAERKPPRTLARTVREKAMFLNMRRVGKRRALKPERPTRDAKLRLRDTRLARTYKHLVYTTLRACRELDKETMRDIAIRIYDLIQWGGVRYAQKYVKRVRRAFLADRHEYGFAATGAVALNLAKLMLIKDEFYVAHLLTSFEKRRRDRQRYNVNPANRDRIRYSRTFHPRFFGQAIDVTLPHWSLYVIRELRFLRHVMPWYHRRDRRLLSWYLRLVDDFAHDDEVEYRRYVEMLECVDAVNGYREYRYPKIEAARSRADQLRRTMRAAATATRAATY